MRRKKRVDSFKIGRKMTRRMAEKCGASVRIHAWKVIWVTAHRGTNSMRTATRHVLHFALNRIHPGRRNTT